MVVRRRREAGYVARAVVQTVIGVSQIQVSRVIRRALERLRPWRMVPRRGARRGSSRTRTNWAGPDVLVVTLEQTFTPAERGLQRMREHQRLRDLRLLFQYASGGDVL